MHIVCYSIILRIKHDVYTVEGAAAADSGLLDVPVSKTGPSAFDMSDVANSLATIQQGNMFP